MPENQNENVKDIVHPEIGNVAENTQTSDQNISEETRPKSEDHNWKEVREIMHQQKEKITELEDRLVQKEKSSTKENDPYAGLSDDDIITVADYKKINSQQMRQIASDQVPQQFSDFNEVIKLVDEYVKENPAAEAAIMNSPNPRLTAYQMVKSSMLYHKNISQTNNKDNVQKALDNSKKPISSQSLGTTSPLNDMQKYEKMTPKRAEEIRRLAEEYASKR